MDLVAGTSSAGGEVAPLSGFENLSGGPGADVLRGDDGPNVLQPSAGYDGRGGDVLAGREGGDTLSGLAGKRTTLDAGSGDDLLYSWAMTERISCGSGDDLVVLVAGGGVVVPRDCERVRVASAVLDRGRVRRGRFVTTVRRNGTRACAVTLTLRSLDGKLHGRRTFALGAAPVELSLGLDAAGRRLARRHGLARLHAAGPCLRGPRWAVRL